MSDLKECPCGELFSDYEEWQHLDGTNRMECLSQMVDSKTEDRRMRDFESLSDDDLTDLQIAVRLAEGAYGPHSFGAYNMHILLNRLVDEAHAREQSFGSSLAQIHTH